MAQNYLTVDRQSPVQSLIQGFGAGQQMIGNISSQQQAAIKNQLLQRELAKEEAVKNALAKYGQEGFDDTAAVKAIMPHNPELALKIKETMRKSSLDQINMYKAGADLLEKFAPAMMDNPAVYHQYQQMMSGMGMGNVLPPVASFINPDTRQFDMPRYQSFTKNLIDAKGIIQAETNAALNPKYHYQPAQDEEGNLILNRVDERTNKVEQIPVKGYKAGINQEVTLADGTKISLSTGGGKKSQLPTGLQPGAQKEIEDRLLGATDNLRLVTDLRSVMNKEFQTWPGQMKQWYETAKEKAGITPTKEQAGYVKRYSEWYAKAKNLHSSILKNLSGLAVTAAEEQRIKAFTIDPDKDSYTQSQSKLQNLETDMESVISRTNYIRKNGLSVKNAPEDIKSIMLSKRKQLTQEALSRGVPKESVDNWVREQMNDYFLRPAQRIGLVE